MARNPSEKAIQILRHLALNEPASKYQIKEKIKPKIHYATVHRIVSDLKKAGFIKVIRSEKFRIESLKVEYYDLTLMGLTAVIQEEQDHLSTDHLYIQEPVDLNLDQIAERHQDLLPLILGKWKLFKESGWDPSLRLVSSCSLHLPSLLKALQYEIEPNARLIVLGSSLILLKPEGIPKGREGDLPDLEPTLMNEIYKRFFFFEPPIEHAPEPDLLQYVAFVDEIYALDKICAKDREISSWIMERLEKLIGQYAKYQSLLQERMKHLETLRRK